jgi:hypothetical protein
LVETKKEGRRVWLSTRQIGIVAALGGLGFAYCALGLYIPIVPPFIVDIREPLGVIIGMAAGPWGALIGGLLMGISGTTPLAGVPYYMTLGFLFAIFSKKIYALTGWKRYTLLSIVIIALNVFILAPWLGLSLSIIYGMTFYDWMVIMWGVGVFPLYIVEEILACAIAMKFAPEFMKPRWLWSGGEKVE